ncbi:MAG: ABC-F family ATP-binding cassette domain-containing protein [Rhizobiaceae bacterium]|nr:ABC-F family ATP-binding cassette domain-containing protein [Rhizobiaceae bacterium]
MPFLSVRNLTFRLPDGRVLLENLDIAFGPERTGLVGRNGVGKSSLLALLTGEAVPTSGSAQRSGTIAVLRQMTDVGADETVADLFGVGSALQLAERALAGEADADEVASVDWTLDPRLDKALADVGLAGLAPGHLLSELSGGQRTRVALAALIFGAPDMILLDEPTNNLDAEGRALVADLVGNWKGGALVVSHDRALLNRMDRIVELSPLGAKVFGGNFDAYRAAREAERDAARRQLQAAEADARRAARDAQIAREKQDRRDAAGRKSRKGSSDPKILLDAKQQRAEATAGRGSRLAEKQGREAAAALADARAAVERATTLSVGLGDTQVPSGKVLVEARDLGIGFDGRPVQTGIDLSIVGPERVAIAGPNGAGKSTLLKTIAGTLAPLGGSLRVPARLAMFDQHVSLLDPERSIVENFRRLNPGASENACRAALARYAFRADAALQVVATLSGGERLRAGLACVLAGGDPPDLLLLDEPTNHLDLDSTIEVEAGLRDFSGALLVVSHDAAFLDAIGIERRISLSSPCRTSPVAGADAS